MIESIQFTHKRYKEKLTAVLNFDALEALIRDLSQELRIYEFLMIRRPADLYPYISLDVLDVEKVILPDWLQEYADESNGEKHYKDIPFLKWHLPLDNPDCWDRSLLQDSWVGFVYYSESFPTKLQNIMKDLQHEREDLFVKQWKPLVSYELAAIQCYQHYFDLYHQPSPYRPPRTPLIPESVDGELLDKITGILIEDRSICGVQLRGTGRLNLVKSLCKAKLKRQRMGDELAITALTVGEHFEQVNTTHWGRTLVRWSWEGIGDGQIYIQDGSMTGGGTTPKDLSEIGSKKYLIFIDLPFPETPDTKYDWEHGESYSIGRLKPGDGQ